MAEPFASPSKDDLKKALELYSDPLLFWATNVAVETLNRMNPNDYDVQESQFGEWIFLTRRLLWKFGLVQIIEHTYKLYEESAEEYWSNWTPPEIEKINQDKVMISKEWKSG